MHPRESIIAKKTARIMRAARKRRGLTQSEVAKLLQTSQANISKLENAMLIPSAPEWFEFCDVMKIPAESLRDGILDAKAPATIRSEQHEGGFRLPKRYIESRGVSIRALMPLLIRGEKTLGEQRFNAAIESLGVDPDVCVELSNVLNVNFTLDLARLLVKEGSIDMKDLSTLGPHYVQPICHGSLHQDYQSIDRAESLMRKWFDNSAFYSTDFDYAVEDMNSSGLTLSVKAREHMKSFQYLNDPVLGDFLCRFLSNKMSAFPSYNGGAPAQVEHLACMYKGDEKCVYRVSFSSSATA